MKEINIARTIIAKRKEKGLTQEALASYMGVSKASVSKWETGQSYPDITFLPILAAYFNVSVDELIGYEPQLTKEDIREVYLRLAADFSNKPFDEVLARCRALIVKYYACFPLLMQMSILLINYAPLAGTPERTKELLREAGALCIRIKEESGDFNLNKQANFVEAFIALNLGNPEEAKELLGSVNDPLFGEEVLLAGAYAQTGDMDKAREITQTGIFRHLLGIVGDLPNYLMLHIEDKPRFQEILRRFQGLNQVFQLDSLHPAMTVNVYLTAANGYAVMGDTENALTQLERYADICARGTRQFLFHGDDFFDRVDRWFEEFELGANPPRGIKGLGKSILDSVVGNPGFESLRTHERYRRVVTILEGIGDNNEK